MPLIAQLIDVENLAKNAMDVEKIVNGIVEFSDITKANSHLTSTLVERSASEGTLTAYRVCQVADRFIAPNSVLQIMLTMHPRLQESIKRMETLVRRSTMTRSKRSKQLIIQFMESELKTLDTLKSSIAKNTSQVVGSSMKRIKTEIPLIEEIEEKILGQKISNERKEALKKTLEGAESITPDKINRTCELTLNQLQKSFQDKIQTVRQGASKAKKAKTKDIQSGKEAMVPLYVRHLKKFNQDFEKLVSEFGNNVKRQMSGTLPALQHFEDSDILFAKALGEIASAKGDGPRKICRYVETSSPKDLENIQGYMGRLKGILPEEATNKMKFLNSIFHKNAFSILADFPPSVRGQMTVELVEGPIWIAGKQYGDGAMLLTGPNLDSAIIGLGELKAGFNAEVLKQIFEKSDKRAADAIIKFTDSDNKIQIRNLTREFSFPNEKTIALTKPPIYVYGWPSQTTEKVDKFQSLVKNQMQSGRELWRVDLPFSAADNELFAHECLKEAVNVLKKADKSWGGQ